MAPYNNWWFLGIAGRNFAALPIRDEASRSRVLFLIDPSWCSIIIRRRAPDRLKVISNQIPGFSKRFSIILISELLTALPSFGWQKFISLAVILSSTHPNPNLSKNMIVSLSISQLASVRNPLFLSTSIFDASFYKSSDLLADFALGNTFLAVFTPTIYISSLWVNFFSDSSKYDKMMPHLVISV